MIQNLIGKLFGSDDPLKKGAPKLVKHHQRDIHDLLHYYQEQNQLLTAVIMDDASKKIIKLTTGIHQIDEAQRTFQVEDFQPQNVQSLLNASVRMQFSLSCDGVRHQFSCHWLNTENQPSSITHRFAYPKGIEQVQLRDAYRISLNQQPPIVVTLTRQSKPIITGHVFDLSSGGLRLVCDGLLYPKPLRGEHFSSIHFVLNDGSPIVGEARLMHWHFDAQKKQTHLGVHFERMDGHTQRSLNRYITEVQRQYRFTYPH